MVTAFETRRWNVSAVVALALILAASTARVEAATDAATEASPSGALEEIVVTAQKKSENAQNVPISITAVSGEQLAQTHITDLSGLQGSVPNVQLGHFSNTPNTAVFTIRGIGVIEPDQYAGVTVSVVQDGVPNYFNMVSLLDLFDVNRVEILRGPQGTLFGANTTGGVINVVTNQPTGVAGGNAQITVGNYGRVDADATVDFPIIDNELAGKVTVMHNGRDGWFTNIVNGQNLGGQDDNAVRGYLKYDAPGGNFNATLIAEYDQNRDGAPVPVNGAVPGDAWYIPPGTTAPGAYGVQYASPCVPAGQPCHAPQDYLAGDSLPNFSNKDTYSATLTMNWNSEAGKITSITGYKTFELSEITDQTSDITFGAGTDRKTHAWQYSEEVRDALQPTDNIEVLVGAFGMLDHYDQYQKTILQISLPGYTLWYLQNQNNWSASVFSQAYWHVTPTITLQGGVRVQHERTAMTAGNYAFLSADGIAVFDGGTPLGGFSEEKSKAWNNVGGKFGVDWQVTPTLLGYANYSRGFKSGGFVGRILLPTDIGPFNPEHVDTVEVGMKSDWLDHRLRANVAVFDTLYSNMQVAELYFTTTASGATANGNTILNAAKSSIRGTEIELTGAPTAQLLVHASIAYLDAHYTDFPYNNPTTGKLESLNGYALQNSPKWSATTGADYRFESRSSQTTFGAQYRYTSTKYNNAIDDTPRSEIQETGYIDANIEWALKGAKWSLNLWGRNLADRRYIDSSYDAPGTYAVVSYAAPREFGLTFKYAW